MELFFLELILFILLLGLSAFFSSSETALFSLDDMQLEQMRRDNHPRIGLIEKLLASPRRLIISILIGNELVNVSASVLSASMVIILMGAENKWINILIMVPILLLFGEITPKTLAIRNNVAFASFESRPLEMFSRIIMPVRIVVHFISERIITLIVGKERSKGNIITEDMVKTLTREAVGEGTLDHDEAHLIEQIFDFGNKTVEDVMTPRSDISFLEIDMPLSKVFKTYRSSRHSKLPVYQGDRDTILGLIYIRDFFGTDIKKLSKQKQPIKHFLRQAYFVPETKPAIELFDKFKERKLSIALTVDEYGGITGLVTMEDLLECIFGQMSSIPDNGSEIQISPLADGVFRIAGSCEIHAFNQAMNADLDHDIADTVAGLLLHLHGELPAPGTIVEYGSFEFVITEMHANRISQIQVRRLDSGPVTDIADDQQAETSNLSLDDEESEIREKQPEKQEQ